MGDFLDNSIVGNTREYTLDLTGMTGRKLDVAATVFDGEVSDGSLELLDDASTVLATASPQGSNSDLAILGFTVPYDGVYTFRLTVVPMQGFRYSLVVTDAMQFETEPNDNAGDVVRKVPAYSAVLGYAGLPAAQGTFQLTVDPNQTTMHLSSSLSMPGSDPPLQIPLTEQAAGSLDAQVAGELTVEVDDSGIHFVSGSLDPIASAGPFQPGSQSADFAGQFDIGISVYAALRNLLFRVDSDPLAWTGDGTFDASQVGVLFTDGRLYYNIVGTSGSLPVANPDTGNLVIEPGQWEVLPGQVRLTLPFHMLIEVTEPTTGLVAEIDLSSQIVATAALPVVDDDYYQVQVGAGELQHLDINVVPPLPPAEAPENTLRARVLLLDPLGNVVADQLAPAAGQGVFLTYPVNSGTYTIVVQADEGAGEYLLEVGGLLSTIGSVIGRELFYNESGFDQFDQGANDTDVQAAAPDKFPYFAGDGLATAANVSSYARDQRPDARPGRTARDHHGG